MAVEVLVTDRDGKGHALEAGGAGPLMARPLMEVLREANLGVEGTCGGACACGTCHVYVAKQWADRLPPRSEDEQMMLDAIAELVEVRDSSRLSCQIPLEEKLSGIQVEIGPVP